MAIANSGFVFANGAMRAITRTKANPTTANLNEIVAAQAAGIKIRVVSVAILVGAVADTLDFRSANTAISHVMVLRAADQVVLQHNDHGWFETAAAEALNINLTTGSDVGVLVSWIALPA